MADLLRSDNPVLKEKMFAGAMAPGETMTIQGTVNKTGLLLLFVVVTAAWTWGMAHSETPDAVYPWMLGGALGGLVIGLITSFKANWAPIAAPVYALLEGLFLGGISALFEKSYPGIAMQAVSLTFHSPFSILYSSSPWGIGISLFITVIAALNLILDFDLIEHGAAMGAPKYMEWYGAFALMVTLVWLYIRMLRLLSQLRRR